MAQVPRPHEKRNGVALTYFQSVCVRVCVCLSRAMLAQTHARVAPGSGAESACRPPPGAIRLSVCHA
eukprot:15457617-Alexandrium_andersonii.AAC.1